jgi:hypothetical protein
VIDISPLRKESMLISPLENYFSGLKKELDSPKVKGDESESCSGYSSDGRASRNFPY